MPKCTECKVEKDDKQFHQKKEKKNGLASICKECANKKHREWSLLNRDKVKANHEKYREENREKCRARGLDYYYKNKWKYKEYRKEHREEHRLYSINYREKNIEKIRLRHAELERGYRKEKPLEFKARKAVYYAVKRKKLDKPEECQMCNKKKPLEAHHKDYNKPLDVIWVCKECHGGIHLTLRNQQNKRIKDG